DNKPVFRLSVEYGLIKNLVEPSKKIKLFLFFLYHTYYDDIVPADIGSQSAQLLKEKGYQVEFENDYNGNHVFRPKELQKIMAKKLNALL
ncbi:33_t:CDS:2, partial [Ambispora gerdemannii]